jgi:serine/threonine protein phosphatase PrpC
VIVLGADFAYLLHELGGLEALREDVFALFRRTRGASDMTRVLGEVNALLSERGPRGCGASVAALGIGGERAIVAWAGGVRVLRLRGLGLATVTRDHGLFEQAVDAGRVADTPAARASFPHPGVLVNALGMADANVETREEPVHVGDVWLVTSRVANALGDAVIRRTLAHHRPDPAACASHLVAQAARSGCFDGAVICAIVDEGGVRWGHASGGGPGDEAASIA